MSEDVTERTIFEFEEALEVVREGGRGATSPFLAACDAVTDLREDPSLEHKLAFFSGKSPKTRCGQS